MQSSKVWLSICQVCVVWCMREGARESASVRSRERKGDRGGGWGGGRESESKENVCEREKGREERETGREGVCLRAHAHVCVYACESASLREGERERDRDARASVPSTPR